MLSIDLIAQWEKLRKGKKIRQLQSRSWVKFCLRYRDKKVIMGVNYHWLIDGMNEYNIVYVITFVYCTQDATQHSKL